MSFLEFQALKNEIAHETMRLRERLSIVEGMYVQLYDYRRKIMTYADKPWYKRLFTPFPRA